MLNKIFFLLFLMFNLICSSEAKVAINKSYNRVSRGLSSENTNEKLVIDYFKCFEGFANKTKACINSKTHKELNASEKDRFITWGFYFEVELLRFTSCAPNTLAAAGNFPLATGDFVCAQVNINKEKKELVFFFKKDGSENKIYSFFY